MAQRNCIFRLLNLQIGSNAFTKKLEMDFTGEKLRGNAKAHRNSFLLSVIILLSSIALAIKWGEFHG